VGPPTSPIQDLTKNPSDGKIKKMVIVPQVRPINKIENKLQAILSIESRLPKKQIKKGETQGKEGNLSNKDRIPLLPLARTTARAYSKLLTSSPYGLLVCNFHNKFPFEPVL
jgi:hypothetical protein